MSSVTEKTSKFDSLPIAAQMLTGIGLLLLIAVIGFAIFFAVDILLLDFDPIGRLISAVSGAVKN